MKINESQLNNLIYEITIKMLNEDDPTGGAMAPQAPGTMPPAAPGTMPPAAPGTMPPAAPGAMPPASSPIEDAKDNANKKKEEIAKKIGDTTGGAPGFSPKDLNDKDKKQLAKQVAENVIKQLTRDFARKK